MWWIEEYECENIGPFGPGCAKKFNLRQGTIGLIGPNGAGKSTILESMVACITGDWSGFNRSKVQCINNQLSPKSKERSFVRVTLNRDGRRCVITRSLKPAGQSMVIDGESPIESDALIKEKLEEIGIDRRILDFCVFKRQNQIYDFLRSKPAERAEVYAVLCRMRECEKIWDMFGGFLNRDADLHREVIDSTDQIKQSMSDHASRMEEIDKQIQDYHKALMRPEYRRRAEEWIELSKRKSALLARRPDAVQKVTHIKEDRLPALIDQLQRDQQFLAVTCRHLLTMESDHRLATEAISTWKVYEDARDRLTINRSRKEAIEKESNTIKEPRPPSEDRGKLEERQLQLLERRGEHGSLLGHWCMKDAEELHSSKPVSCPACGQVVANSTKLVEDAQAEVLLINTELRAIKAMLSDWCIYQTKKSAYDRWLIGWQQRMQQVCELLQTDDVLVEPEVSLDRAQEILFAFATRRKQEVVFADKVHGGESAIALLRVHLEAAQNALTTLDEDIASCDYPEDKLEHARQRLAEHREAEIAIARLEGERAAIERSLQDARRRLAEMIEQIKRNKKARAMAKIIAEARDAIHRERLPQRVAQANLIRLEGDVNKALGLFGNPFHVQATDDLSFTIYKPGEPGHRAEWLSGGQQVILAIAFWDAVGSLFRRDVGMLVLDEPTANLDGVNVAYLSEAMTAMASRVRGKRQIIMVTHEELLKDAFDQVITIGS